MSLNKIFTEFNSMYGLNHFPIDKANLEPMCKLIQDEVTELHEEVYIVEESNEGYDACETRVHPDLIRVVKEAIDNIYITGQQLTERNIDVDACLAEVHRSNMSKRVHIDDIDRELEIAQERYPNIMTAVCSDNPEYVVMKCADTGKVIKPSTYSAAVITLEMIGL